MKSIPNVDVPEGTSGKWKVERFSISKEAADFENMRAMFSFGGGGRHLFAGTYTRLMRGGTLVMSDTHAEKNDHWAPVRYAQGRVLIAGLGLGMVLNAILIKDEVVFVKVLEKSEDVIQLVGPYYKEKFGDRLEIVCCDAFEYSLGDETYDLAYFDIWDTICGDNCKDFTKLKRRFPPRKCRERIFWCEDLCRRNR